MSELRHAGGGDCGTAGNGAGAGGQFTEREAEQITAARGAPMPRDEKLFRFLASLMLREFYGRATIRFESGKVTHVETETRRMCQYGDLPEHLPETEGSLRHQSLCKTESRQASLFV